MTQNEQRNARIEQNLGLVHHCANRFRGRGVEYDDLFSAGCVGLTKAADGYDPALGYAFSTYAVPAILGEIRRLFRDGGAVKVGRAAKEKARQLLQLQAQFQAENGREGTINEIAEQAGVEPAEAAQLLSALTPPLSLTIEDEAGESQADLPVDSGEETLLDRLELERAMQTLSPQDQSLITCRYYQNMTQSATAAKLGMTQVQVSRREKRILLLLRQVMD